MRGTWWYSHLGLDIEVAKLDCKLVAGTSPTGRTPRSKHYGEHGPWNKEDDLSATRVWYIKLPLLLLPERKPD